MFGKNKKQEKEQEDKVEIVVALSTNNIGILAVAKSILENADIKYVARQESGSSVIAAWASYVSIIVKKEDEEKAKELLKELA